MVRIFISYSRQDQLFVRRLTTDLERLGADIWLDVDDIPIGMKWSNAIQQGLDSSNIMIVVVSPYSMSSKNVEDEWQYFHDKGKPLILALLEPSRMHFQLSRIQYVDFHTKPYDEALRSLHDHLNEIGAALETMPQNFVSTAEVKPAGLRPGPTSQLPGMAPSKLSPPQGWRGIALVVLLLVVGSIYFLGTRLSNFPPLSIGQANTPTETNTLTPSNTATETNTPTNTATETNTPTETDTPTNTDTPTDTATPTATNTPTPSDTPTHTPSNTPTETPTITPTNKPGFVRFDAQGVGQVWVPAGCFNMGSDPKKDRYAKSFEQPVHEVCFTNGYWIDQFEVTIGDYQKFIDAGGYKDTKYWSEKGAAWLKTTDQSGPRLYRGVPFEDDYPRTGVTWYEAEAYANWRGGRLPTEAEWEYAARGPDAPIFPWGDDFEPELANIAIRNGKLEVVGGYDSSRSWVGAYDMTGNVWEWVSDWYSGNYYKQSPDSDPSGPPSGTLRVIRGGTYDSALQNGRGSNRFWSNPVVANKSTGFRIVVPGTGN